MSSTDKNSSPSISIAMSVYNGEKYLSEAIESILKQTWTDFEFIIVDDGSTDTSAEIIRTYTDKRIKFIQQQNRGLSAALNVCIENSRGKYIARMDADDICLPNRLELQFKYMEQHPECVLLSGSIEYIDEDGNSLHTKIIATEDAIIKNSLPLSCQIIHPASFYRKSDFLKTRGYREEIVQHVEDILLWNEFAPLGKFANLEPTLLKYRLCPGSISGYNRFVRKKKQAILLKVVQNQSPSEDDIKFLRGLGNDSKEKKQSRYLSQIANMHYSQGRFKLGAQNFRKSLTQGFTALAVFGYFKCTLKSLTTRRTN